jgi:ABC-type enterochelin transport system ATPase subunit
VDLEIQRRKILSFLDPKSEGKTTKIHFLLDLIRLDGDAMAVFVSHAENVDSQKLAIHPPVFIIIALQIMAQITNRKDFDGSYKRCNPLPCQLAKGS